MRSRLIIGPDGQIAVPPRQAEALGLSGGGDVDLVSARGAFALLVPVRGDAPREWFAGSLAAITVPEVFQFVFSSLKTGVLLLAFGEEGASAPDEPERLRRRSVYFKEGQVVFASSSSPDERLGRVLVAHGLVPKAEVDRCARLVQSGRPLGQVLVDEGVLTAGQLYEAITLQVKEIFLACFLESAGEFAFLEGQHDERNRVKLPERTRDLLLQGMKRLERAELARAEALAAAGALPEGGDSEAEARAPTPVPAVRPSQAPRASGPFEVYRRIFKRVYGALAAAEPDAAARLNSWFERLPELRRAVFDGVRISGDGEMDVTRVLANVDAAGAHRGAAARARSLEALEEFLAFALFEAKNRLPRPDAERLLREVGRMQVGKA